MENTPLQDALPDIQGIITSGFGHLRFSAYLFLHFEDAAKGKAWLDSIAGTITTSERWPKDDNNQIIKPESARFIGLTWHGLRALEMPFAALDTFPPEFIESMVSERRSTVLGDVGPNAPQQWEYGTDPDEIHAILMLLANSAEARDSAAQTLTNDLSNHQMTLVAREDGGLLPGDREHFGWLDGVSQPHLEETPRYTDVSEPSIAHGEFILGYENEYGKLPFSPELKGEDIGKNGSYLVYRKMAQDVAGFWQDMREKAGDDPAEQVRLGSKMVGRWPKGAPLTLERDTDREFDRATINRFLYAERDGIGDGCPFGSHIRRTNPRDSLPPNPKEALKMADRHLIIRRGMPYGDPLIDFDNLPPQSVEDDGNQRGLLFFCINANIARQFEFIQQQWVNNTKFHGLYNDPDPIIGTPEEGQEFTIPRDPVRKKIKGLQRYVTTRSGAYFFLPGISALKKIATM